jgi:hypothetical protein
MKVFLSWSKPRSQEVASALRDWLPDVLQTSDPWMAAEDIQAGQRWGKEIESQLDTSAIGIICVTPENQAEPWLNFEAGAISKKAGAEHLSRVAPYVLGMRKEDLRLPIGQFQAKAADERGTFELVQMINRLQERPLPDAKLKDAFTVWWPKLEARLKVVAEKNHSPVPKRSSEEKIDELLDLTRSLFRRLEKPDASYTVQLGGLLDDVNPQEEAQEIEALRTELATRLSMVPMGMMPKSVWESALRQVREEKRRRAALASGKKGEDDKP